MIKVTEHPIDVGQAYKHLSQDRAGSVVVHLGIVKPVVDDRATRGIRLVRDGDLEGELKRIERQLRDKWGVIDVLLVRRLGDLSAGEFILVAAVSAKTRDAAFGACQEAVEALKKKRGLKKEELYE